MSLRFVSPLVLGLLLLAMVFPVSAQQQDAEQQAEGAEGEQGNGGEEDVEPPSVTLVHFGPESAGGSLASLYPDQAIELGEGEAAFTGLLKRETTTERHGGILVVAPSGQSPDQGLAGAVRSQLPKAGWMTLSIAQPAEPVPEIPERVFSSEAANGGDGAQGDQDEAGADEDGPAPEEDGANGEDENADEEPDPPDITIEVADGAGVPERNDDWQSRATERLDAAVKTLRDEEVGVTVLVGIGDGADLILRYARANGATFAPDQFAMALVGARLRPPFSTGLGAELGEGYQVPILDLRDRSPDSERAPDRAASARRAGFVAYTQSALPMPRGAGAREQRRVPARVRGWLHGLFVEEER